LDLPVAFLAAVFFFGVSSASSSSMSSSSSSSSVFLGFDDAFLAADFALSSALLFFVSFFP